MVLEKTLESPLDFKEIKPLNPKGNQSLIVQLFSLAWEDPLEKEMATHSRSLAWEIPWTEEPGGLHGVTKESATTLSTKQQQQPELKGHDLKIFKENWRFMVLVCFIIILFKYVLYLKLNSWSKTNYYDQCGKFYFPLGK